MPKYRMIHVDHYMCEPISPFDDQKSQIGNNRPISKVPVIRVFGADNDGNKICIHVHGFYPYVAIQNREPNNPELARRIVEDIERGLKSTVEENRRQESLGSTTGAGAAAITVVKPTSAQLPQADFLEPDHDSNLEKRIQTERRPLLHLSSEQRYPIHRIQAIKAYNYYGYHNQEEHFFKLYLYNPRMVKQLALLFESCRVLERFVPVFWAHLPYILLFFIDNNLRGMQFIEVEQLYWRKGKNPSTLTRSQSILSPLSPINNTSSSPSNERINQELDYEIFTTDVEPISTCQLEADIRFEWILNRQRFGSKGNDDALQELWLDDQEATQTSSTIDPKLPLYNLERSYLQQLCESCGLNYDELDLQLTDRPRPKPKAIEPNYSDSDDSLRTLTDNLDDLERFAQPTSPDEPVAGTSCVQQVPPILPPPAEIEDEFSDDEEFLKSLSRLEKTFNVKIENMSQPMIKIEKLTPSSDNSATNSKMPLHQVKSEPEDKHHIKIEPELVNIKTEPNLTQPALGRKSSRDEDEFSDDDQFMIEALIKADTQDSPLKPQPSSSKSNPVVQIVPVSSAKQTKKKEKRRFSDNSLIDGRSIICSTVKTKSGSQRSTSSSREAVNHEYQFLCIMSLELHITTRAKLNPDPAFDPIEAAFYCIRNDIPETSSKPTQVVGMIITDPFRSDDGVVTFSPTNNLKSPSARSNLSIAQKVRGLLHKTGLSMEDIELNIVDTELDLIIGLVNIVKQYDPEILLGYEMERLSWGYVLERSTILNINISVALSRIVETSLGNNSKVVESTFVQPIMFTGRMVFSVWRIIKHEINLNTCSYERIHHHALKERVPCFDFSTLTKWYNENRNRWRVIDYYLTRVTGQMRILDKFDLIAKVSELARVYGTQFIDVITRGSQIGIESMMLRLAKLQNMFPLSPTVMQRHKMKAPEALPLVMEPETNIYYNPVVVLDFQSLYPSVVIAYNYCYSTCLGRVTDLETNEKHGFGCSQLYVDQEEVRRLLESNSVHVSPCGVAYVKKNIRHGVLPKMLSELITTRAMVKDQMKKNMKSERPNRRLQRILDHRQHGLKMMANTTYGYAGASYTGRMPCVEIADSIVSKGRETLENAIELVESKEEWDAKVIYGDTDSIFIEFKNCDRDTAFKRAYEMVDAISAQNPYPIKMKFEKIYQPCVLQTKKRYCGFKYESPEQTKPEFEAKGIETVRRDCCPAAARMLEMALRIQFTTRDVNQVKEYVQHQFIKIMSGKLSNIQDFIFARQYKPRDMDKTESVFVPAWQITKRFLATDPRAEPRVGERVPFVIIYGEPRTPLVNLAKTPLEVLENLSYRINADYYIQKIICPTLNRVFCTMKVDTLVWFKSMPHQNIIHRSHYLVAQKNQFSDGSGFPKQSTMSQYFSPSHCPICAKSIPVNDDICDNCREDPQSSVTRLTEEIAKSQQKLFAYHQLCRACCALERTNEMEDSHYNPCISYDCQNLFRYHQAKLDAMNSNFLSQLLKNLN